MELLKKILDFIISLFSKKENSDNNEVITIEESAVTINVEQSAITVTNNTEVNEEKDKDKDKEQSQGFKYGDVTEKEQNILSVSNSKKRMKILIDNGHGNDTKGKRSPYSLVKALPEIPFFEYQWNREIASAIVDRLDKMGYDAQLLVTEIRDISLGERVKRTNAICNQLGPSNVLLISVHANAGGNGTSWYSAKGWSAYTTIGKTKSDRLADFLYDEAEKNFKGMKIRTDTSDGDRDWESDFYIIKHVACPAVLTENFFYDNVDDVKYILSETGKENVIKTHVDGIINYINSL